ncbi:Oncoprotein-induced transcript 3 protein [Branchiostoma belcheri]|nr:Oncoprotein-induced transcript 3 protein [Branchiostoma belcheri]
MGSMAFQAPVLLCISVALCCFTGVFGLITTQQAAHLKARVTEVKRRVDAVKLRVGNTRDLVISLAQTPLPSVGTAGNCCGNILRHATVEVDQSTGYRVPAGWTMCYIDQRDTAHRSTPCRDLLQGIPQYGDAQRLLSAGGNFGCWHGDTGASPGPAYASNDVIQRSCEENIQHSHSMGTWSSRPTFGVCIKGITCGEYRHTTAK